jgi:hypothetical protein
MKYNKFGMCAAAKVPPQFQLVLASSDRVPAKFLQVQAKFLQNSCRVPAKFQQVLPGSTMVPELPASFRQVQL